jgi:hypothetical protein
LRDWQALWRRGQNKLNQLLVGSHRPIEQMLKLTRRLEVAFKSPVATRAADRRSARAGRQCFKNLEKEGNKCECC